MEDIIEGGISEMIKHCKRIASAVEEDYIAAQIILYGLNCKFFKARGIILSAEYRKDIRPKVIPHYEARDVKSYAVGASDISYFTSGNMTKTQDIKQRKASDASTGVDADLVNILKLKNAPEALKGFGITVNTNVYVSNLHGNISCNPDGVFLWRGALCPVEVKSNSKLIKLEAKITKQTFRNKRGASKISLKEAKAMAIDGKDFIDDPDDNLFDPKGGRKSNNKIRSKSNPQSQKRLKKIRNKNVVKPDSARSLCHDSVRSNALSRAKGFSRSKSQSRYAFHNSGFDFEDRVPSKVITAYMPQLKTQMYVMKSPVCLLIYRDEMSVYYSVLERPAGLCDFFVDVHKNVKRYFDK